MATNKKHNRNHSHENKRKFPGEDADVRLENCFFVIDDGRWTDKADVAMAAQDDGHTVHIVPNLAAIARLVPTEEWVPDVGDPLHNLPSD
jgi:hypothetical protein